MVVKFVVFGWVLVLVVYLKILVIDWVGKFVFLWLLLGYFGGCLKL